MDTEESYERIPTYDPGTRDRGLRDLSNEPINVKLSDSNYLAFYLIGIALLWPWNSFLSASLYFQHDIFHDNTVYARIYISTMMTVSTVSSVFSNIWLSKIQHNYTGRVVNGLFIEVLVFVVLCGIVMIHRWLPYFVSFTCIMLLVMVSSVAIACAQTGITAMANVFGSEYNHALMVGQAVAGVLPSLVLFLVSLSNSTQEQSAGGIILYFMTTTIISLASIFAFKRSDIPVRGGEVAPSDEDCITQEEASLHSLCIFIPQVEISCSFNFHYVFNHFDIPSVCFEHVRYKPTYEEFRIYSVHIHGVEPWRFCWQDRCRTYV